MLLTMSHLQREPGGQVPVGQHVVHVEHLEGGAGGLEDEDEEQADQGQPEVGGAETAGAAAGRLHEEGEPGQQQEHDRQHEGEEEAGQVEVEVGLVAAAGEEVRGLVHADGGVVRSAGDGAPVGVLGPGPDVREECGGHREQRGQEPDQRDVDGVRPRPGVNQF